MGLRLLHRILITGGTGFVGTHLIQYLRSTASDLFVLASDRSTSWRESGVHYYQVDIRKGDDLRSAIRQIRPNDIYHLAGVSAVGLSWSNPRLTYEVNVGGTFNLFEAAFALVPATRILNVSTAQVYAPSDEPLTEESPVRPNNPYSASKAIAELLGIFFGKTKNGGVITARSFNHTGPGQLPTFFIPSVAKQFTEVEAARREPILTVGNIELTRDFTDVRDVVRAYVALLEKGTTGETYNVCSGIGARLSDLIKQFQAICSTKVTINVDPARVRAGETQQIVGDSGKIRRETGWSPRIPLERTVRDLLDYWREKIRASASAY